MKEFKDLLYRNRWTAAFFAAAAVAVLLFVWLKWWALLAVPVIALATYLGHLMDRGGFNAVKALFVKLFFRNRNSDHF